MHILNNITTRHNTHINEHTIPIRLFSKEGTSITLRALVDTGALQGNYISGAAYALIEEYGFAKSVHNIRVCAAFNDCQYSTISITLPCSFNYNLVKLQPFENTLSFNVLSKISYDLIIGRPSIVKYGIWERTLPPNAWQIVSSKKVSTKTRHDDVSSGCTSRHT